MDCVTEIASPRWPPSNIHQEFFSPPQNLHRSDDAQFTVVLAKRGIKIIVPLGRSIVDTLHDHGINVDASYQQGFCGTCLTEVIEGEVDHRDTFLSAEERAVGKCILPCVSHAKRTRILLNL
jgi:vanillate O-demethylase ferredoxin subunit